MPFLICARIAAEVKKIGKTGLEALYEMKKPWTDEDSKELKLQNEWAWKEDDTPVVDADYPEAAEEAKELAAKPVALTPPAVVPVEAGGAGAGAAVRAGTGAGTGAGTAAAPAEAAAPAAAAAAADTDMDA